MKNLIPISVITLCLTILILVFVPRKHSEPVSVTEKIVKDSIVNIYEPIFVYDTIIDTLEVENLMIIHDTVKDTIICYIPISSKYYLLYDSSEVWISGYKANLDSIKLRFKEYHTVEKIIEKENKKFLWDIGGGISVQNSHISPYLDTRAILSFKKINISVSTGIAYNGKYEPFFNTRIGYNIN